MYVQRSIVHYYCEIATLHAVCIVEVPGTVNNIKILNVAQQCFYSEFMSAALINSI
jgi:hypothetical protein